MSLVTVSTKRKRVYTRQFDHEEAIARRKAGESVIKLAREYGVSETAIRRVLNPDLRKRMNELSLKSIMSGTCVDCGKQGISRHGDRCVPCAQIHRTTSVREDTLRCDRCQRWLSDESFGSAPGRFPHRRNRRRRCRQCDTWERKQYREKGKVPCEGCGKMVEGKGRARGENPDRPYLCFHCAVGVPGVYLTFT